MRQIVIALMTAGLSAAIAGCGGNAQGSGQLSVAVADAPVDGATAVVVKFSGVEIKARDEAPVTYDFATPRTVDLLATAGGQAFVLIDDEEVPSGDYEYIRLKVISDRDTADSYIDLEDGSRANLFVPSGSQSGLKLNGGLAVPDGGVRSVVVDFDLRHSIVKPEGQAAYTLKPVLRLVDAEQIGLVRGSVDASRLSASGCTGDINTGAGNAVYIYTGTVATPGDAGGSGAPLVSGTLHYDTVLDEYRYVVAYLPAGTYTAAFSCQAGDDQPETDEAIAFSAPITFTVVAGQTTTVDFAAAGG
ncbi:MAG: DUF4382 domain-containing protein [Stagnimonas sp.]|nr:DUF4382 domain-containing protein [Stagnimonas sp.]